MDISGGSRERFGGNSEQPQLQRLPLDTKRDPFADPRAIEIRVQRVIDNDSICLVAKPASVCNIKRETS